MKEKINSEYVKTEITANLCEISGDYILPDSYPDVKSILSCTGRISEISKYAGASEFETSGNIVYNIMFSAAGDEGDVICSVSFTDSFKNLCKYKSPSNISGGMLTRLRDVSCRTANPRKFSIKSTFDNLLYENISCQAYPAVNSTENDDGMQYKYGEATVFRCKSAGLEEHSFSDNIEIDMKLPEIDEIVHCDAGLTVKDDRIIDSSEQNLKLGGVFAVTVVYRDSDGKYHSVNKDLPFGITLNRDEYSSIGEIDTSTVLLPSVCLSALNINVGKNQYDENKVIELDADYDIDLLILSSEKIEYVTDAYSINCNCECKYETETFLTPLERVKNNFTYSDSRAKSELGLDPAAAVFCAVPKIAEVRTDKNGDNLSITGKIAERTVSTAQNNSMREKDVSFAFAYKTSRKAEDTASLLGSAVLTDNRVRNDADKIYVDAEMYLDCIVTAKTMANICKSVNVSGKISDENKGLFSIYYPVPGDTVWNTAKRMRTTVDRICELNNITENVIITEPIVIE